MSAISTQRLNQRRSALRSPEEMGYRPGPTTEEIGRGRELMEGHFGPAVEELQGRLQRLGYLAPPSSDQASPLDQIFGSRTRAAVAAFQRANGLTEDGIVGRNTLARLNAASPPAGAPAAPAADTVQVAPAPTVDTEVVTALRAREQAGRAAYRSLERNEGSLAANLATLRARVPELPEAWRAGATRELDALRDAQAATDHWYVSREAQARQLAPVRAAVLSRFYLSLGREGA